MRFFMMSSAYETGAIDKGFATKRKSTKNTALSPVGDTTSKVHKKAPLLPAGLLKSG